MKTEALLEKYGIAVGDRVRVQRNTLDVTGTVLPVTDSSTLSLKLDSGYNAGFDVTQKITITRIGKGRAVGKAPVAPLHPNPALPKILVFHTGGTIASRVDYRTGAVSTSFSPQDLLTLFPTLGHIAQVDTRLVGNMWSEDMRFAHYTLLAKTVEKELRENPDIKGIIIAHGTDTLGYTAAALAFALSNLPLPVILVGSQRSSDRGSTDAHDNLVAAAHFITKSNFAGVAICMHASLDDGNCVILPATKTRKMHTSRRDAFQTVNAQPIAQVNARNGEIKFQTAQYPRATNEPLRVRPAFEEKVALVKMHPNFNAEQLKPFVGYKGLIIEGMALGQMPIGVPDKLSAPNARNFVMLKKIIKSGCIVVMTSQCLFGRVQMHVYDKAVDLVNAGVIAGEDLLPETALVKLSWLLANEKHPPKIRSEMVRNCVGEISAFSRTDGFIYDNAV